MTLGGRILLGSLFGGLAGVGIGGGIGALTHEHDVDVSCDEHGRPHVSISKRNNNLPENKDNHLEKIAKDERQDDNEPNQST